MGNHANAPQAGTDTKRFRTNPVEIGIFLVVTMVFANSIYRLFYDSPGFQTSALVAMESSPISEGRSPASVSQPSFANIELRCEALNEQDATAGKVRLTGGLCGLDAETGADKLVKTTVTNTANKFTATVFMDVNAGKFSTDYIPLNSGKNPIRLEFAYRGGKVVSQDLVLNKP
ncbi:MAG: hypothetical protein NDJ90_02920 [Oligoflexia bacterium]|nr:hypothetical protein [Oligoflexia bacterium]